MLDPFPAPPQWLASLVAPVAARFNLSTLPLHIHEVLFAFLFYNFINLYFSKWISTKLFPNIYPQFNVRTRINWDVHVVSLVQSTLINSLSLWVMFTDPERDEMDSMERIYGYTGTGGLIQAFALGYFLWDLIVCLIHFDIFGPGLLAHALSAVCVFTLGFRPFVNYYGPIFLLYELSSPFLNFHWFFDKVNMTGSRAQWYNGMLLLATFFGARLMWGSYQSIMVFRDVWTAIQRPGTLITMEDQKPVATNVTSVPESDTMRFAGEQVIPIWLALAYLGSNAVLNSLNWFWFNKMIETVMKRFREPKSKEKIAVELDEDAVGGKKVLTTGKTEVRRRKG